MIDMRFARLASVGLTVRAPKPDTCDELGKPGNTDILLPADIGVEAFVPARGDFGGSSASRLWSGVRKVLSIERDC
jgi:hypothetical protein